MPLGRLQMETCWPLNQVLPQQPQIAVSTLNHLNPTVINSLQMRVSKPNGRLLGDATAPPGCASDEVACKMSFYRSSLTPNK